MTACFIVRAQVIDGEVKDAFDRWYQEEHLKDAYDAFDDAAAARAIPGSDALERLVVEFDRTWGNKVTRSREIVDAVQTIGG